MLDSKQLLPLKEVSQLAQSSLDPLSDKTITQAKIIVDAVRTSGVKALREYALGFGDIKPDEKLVIVKDELQQAYQNLESTDRRLLERTAKRISDFAISQKDCLKGLSKKESGSSMGHSIIPINTAGCYAPGGRYPLPSSVLMTVCTARAAGVSTIVLASPKAAQLTRAAAYIAGADLLLLTGGAQAIAALAYGTEETPCCDIIVGPGNKWVTAAKYLVSKDVGIDMLAGPSELVIIADRSAKAQIVAADLIAQAEHDLEALPVLISLDYEFIAEVQEQLEKQLALLPTKDVASQALSKGFSLFLKEPQEAAKAVNFLAPEHLELELENPREIIPYLRNYGALFIGHNSAEVFCDYGLGPNHVLPTSRSARYRGGLSVFSFLKIATWLEVEEISSLKQFAEDAAQLARLEGLIGHARSIESRFE